jgi:predicted ATPase
LPVLRTQIDMFWVGAPLTLPGPDDPGNPDGSEAVALFADRAREADAGFALDADTGPVVARLVAHLDGMPLAIELAAARVEALGVPQLLARIGDRFTLLEAGDRLAATRQRSLAATVEWSYRLLDERERPDTTRLMKTHKQRARVGPRASKAHRAAAGIRRDPDRESCRVRLDHQTPAEHDPNVAR